jgi:hypothetical protein
MKTSDHDKTDTVNPADLDDCLAQTDLGKLAAILGNELSNHPPFHNVFSNQFPNGPGFRKAV